MGDQENAEASAEATVNKAMANVSISESNSVITNQNDNQIITNQEDTEQNIESEQNNSLVKIYVGSMPPEIDEDGLKSLLSENSLPQPETVLVKRGYAFLEYTDQIKADETISVVDGLEHHGYTLRAEMSVGTDKKSLMTTTYKVVVTNVPPETSREDLEPLLKDTVAAIDVSVNGENQMVTLTYTNKEDAEKAVNELQETEFRGQTLQARLTERRSPRRSGGVGLTGGGGNNPRHVEFPLRILVQSDMVGAIIGRGGQTIRQITQQTRARVDVHRKDSVGSVEKAITIYGQPDNCSNACLAILKVMQEEARNTEKSEDIPLKILAHNNLIGRIIGKQGSTIKRIMEDTETKITVSSINEINSFNMERIITVRGEPENICRAEAEVSAKLRQAYESDLNSMAPQNVMFPGLHPAAANMVPPLGMGMAFNTGLHHQPHVRLSAPSAAFLSGYYPQAAAAAAAGAHQYNGVQMSPNKVHQGSGVVGPTNGPPSANPNVPSVQSYGMVSAQDASNMASSLNNVGAVISGASSSLHAVETTHMYIPNSAVGAVIGAKGSYIRDLNKYSGFSIKIASATDETSSYPAAVNASDRRVTIVGPSDRFWAPQYLIYEKLKIEGFTDPHDGDVTLTIEMFVPSSQVGRIIGKGGTNVRELQRLTGAIIKLPEQLSPPPKDETSVVIIGKWIQALTAQQRLRAMLAQQTGNTTTAPAYKAQNGTSSQGCAPAAMLVGQAAALQPSAAAAIAVVKSDIE